MSCTLKSPPEKEILCCGQTTLSDPDNLFQKNCRPTIYTKPEFVSILLKTEIDLLIYRPSINSYLWCAYGFGIDSNNNEVLSSDLCVSQITGSPGPKGGIIGLSEITNTLYQVVFEFDEKKCKYQFNLEKIENVIQVNTENDNDEILYSENFMPADDLINKNSSISEQEKETSTLSSSAEELQQQKLSFIHLASNDSDVFAIDQSNSIYNVLEKKFVWKLRNGKIIKLVCGFSHTLILTDSGAIYAWGNGSRGQLGQDVIILDEATPTRIEFFDDLSCIVVDIVAGGFHSLALTSEGDVYSWGWNESNQLGHSAERLSSVQCIPYPVDLGSLSNPITAISAGSRHSVVQMKDGSIYSWGFNKFGQLGLGDEENRSSPTQVDLSEFNNSFESVPKYIFCGRWSTFFVY